LGSINEIEAGNEADNESEYYSESNDSDNKHSKRQKKPHALSTIIASNEVLVSNLTAKLNLNETEQPNAEK